MTALQRITRTQWADRFAEGIKTCLSYPRGSEAQVRCLEEIGEDVAFYLGTVTKEKMEAVHNPEAVSESALPAGFRFGRFSETGNYTDSTFFGLPVKIWSSTHSTWADVDCQGAGNRTYAVPNES